MEKEFDLCCSDYGTVKDLRYDAAILPWGATEPHNLHLPYLTDSILSHDIAVSAAKLAQQKYGVRYMVLPPVTFGSQNPGQQELPFCIHTRYETQKAILIDIVSSLVRQGISRLIIINGHGGNIFKNMIRDLYCMFPDVIIACSEWYKVCRATDFFDNPGDHADELETSVMMHYHPELVDLSKAGDGNNVGFAPELLASGKVWIPRNWSRISRDTGVGDPRSATAEKGRSFAEAVAEKYAEFMSEFISDKLYEDWN